MKRIQALSRRQMMTAMFVAAMALVVAACSDPTGNEGQQDVGEPSPDTESSAPDTESSAPDSGDNEDDTGDAEECSEVCGDVTGDGEVSGEDVLRLSELVDADEEPTECEFTAGDILGDGELGTDDVEMLQGLIDGSVTGGCESCELSCGDANADGDVTVADLSQVADVIENDATLSVCQFQAADVNGDGTIDGDDLALLEAHVDDGVDISCAGEEGEAGELDPVVDCADREQLPSDWVRKTSGSNSCIWTGAGIDGEKDCRFFAETWPQEWPGTSNRRNLTMGPASVIV